MNTPKFHNIQYYVDSNGDVCDYDEEIYAIKRNPAYDLMQQIMDEEWKYEFAALMEQEDEDEEEGEEDEDETPYEQVFGEIYDTVYVLFKEYTIGLNDIKKKCYKMKHKPKPTIIQYLLGIESSKAPIITKLPRNLLKTDYDAIIGLTRTLLNPIFRCEDMWAEVVRPYYYPY